MYKPFQSFKFSLYHLSPGTHGHTRRHHSPTSLRQYNNRLSKRLLMSYEATYPQGLWINTHLQCAELQYRSSSSKGMHIVINRQSSVFIRHQYTFPNPRDYLTSSRVSFIRSTSQGDDSLETHNTSVVSSLVASEGDTHHPYGSLTVNSH